MPNALGPVIVAAILGIGNTIVLEAGPSFPGLAIVVTVLPFNLVGDGLRHAMDPRMRGG